MVALVAALWHIKWVLRGSSIGRSFLYNFLFVVRHAHWSGQSERATNRIVSIRHVPLHAVICEIPIHTYAYVWCMPTSRLFTRETA